MKGGIFFPKTNWKPKFICKWHGLANVAWNCLIVEWSLIGVECSQSESRPFWRYNNSSRVWWKSRGPQDDTSLQGEKSERIQTEAFRVWKRSLPPVRTKMRRPKLGSSAAGTDRPIASTVLIPCMKPEAIQTECQARRYPSSLGRGVHVRPFVEARKSRKQNPSRSRPRPLSPLNLLFTGMATSVTHLTSQSGVSRR